MSTHRGGSVLIVLVLLAACGGGGSAATTTSSVGATTTTTAAGPTTTTTTTLADNDPLARLLTAPVINPLASSGLGMMEYSDASETAIRSVDPVTASGDRLFITTLDPIPAVTGLGPDQFLLAARLVSVDGTIGPTASVLFSLVEDNWIAAAIINDAAILEFLESTSDYAAAEPDGEAIVTTTMQSFDWASGASFTATVTVADEDGAEVFSGAIACVLEDALDCELTSDDGVYRPGDEGAGVEDLQEQLIALGYLAGSPSGTYDTATRDGVRTFQRDYRLSRDGIAGPQTVTLLQEVASGESDIVMASADGIGALPMDRAAAQAMDDLEETFGAPEYSSGWYAGPCDAQQWFKMQWGGFTAIFSDHGGVPARLSGWYVSDIDDLPSWLYFVGGIRPGWDWADLQGIGAGFESNFFGLWYHESLGYALGMFDPHPLLGSQPEDDAKVASFGVGTGGYSC